jgi:hypothetical protein
MDRLSKAPLRLIVALGVLTVVSVALAVAEDRTPARAQPSVVTQFDLPEGHERMLSTMRASAHSHHLERMRDDADWQALRDPAHAGHLEVYQDEIDRMLARPRPLRETTAERSP